MKILLTGVAGFIGSHVAQRLLKRGDEVIGIDNFNDYYDPQQKWDNTLALQQHSNFELLPIDIRNIDASNFANQKIDAIIHLAAMAGVRNSVKNPSLYFDVNLNGSQRLIELSRQFEIKNFVFASTSSTYGNTHRIPFVETDFCGEPLHPYAASKRAVEQIGFAYHHNYGLNFTALRFFTVFGPAGRPDMMPWLVADSIYTGQSIPLFRGSFHRDWTYVDDIADGVVCAVDRPLGFEIINLGRGAPVSLTDFISKLETTAGGRADMIPTPAPVTEMAVTFADNSKALRLLGHQPSTNVDEGIAKFWAWFLENKASQARHENLVAVADKKIA